MKKETYYETSPKLIDLTSFEKKFKKCVKCKRVIEKGAYLEPPVITKNEKGVEIINPGIWLCSECAKEYFLDLKDEKHLREQIRRVLKQHYF